MTFELYTNAVLTRDIAEYDLCAGDVVKIIEYYAEPGPSWNLLKFSLGASTQRKEIEKTLAELCSITRSLATYAE